MSEALTGTARVNFEVDLSNLEVAVSRSKGKLTDLGSAAEAAFRASDRNAQSAANTLIRYADRLGMTIDQQKAYNAAIRGVPVAVIEAVVGKINKTRTATEQAAIAARELAAAQEQVAAFNIAAQKAAENDMLREQERVVGALTAQFHALEAAEQQQADFALAAAKAAENDALREQQRVVRALTERFHELEAAEQEAAHAQAFVRSLEQQALAVDKTRAEMLELKAAELGVQAQAAPFIAKLKEQEAALHRSGIQFNKYGLSAKQTAAALRQVPAQMTDIFVSLQGGQRPLTVLLQQGGQLKDVFGGVVPAARAMGSAVLGLVNPFTITAAIVGGLAVAAYKGEQEFNRYQQTLALIGPRSGATANQMADLAAHMTTLETSTGKAAEALIEVAKSGKFTEDQFAMVAQSAVDMEHATGQALSKTVEQFASLAKDPAKAVAKLNEETHFLTAEIYDQIVALQEQGRTQEASTLAMETWADTVSDRAADVKENLGTLQKAWRGVANVAKAAWDAMLDVGREDTVNERITQLGGEIDKLKNSNWAYSQYGNIGSDARKEQIERRRKELRKLLRQERDETRAALAAAGEQEANDYAVALKADILSHKNADEKRAAEITRSRAASQRAIEKALAAGNKTLADAIAANQKEYERVLNSQKKAKSPVSADNAEARAALEGFKATLAEKQALIKNDTAILQAEYSAKRIAVADYYAEQKKLTERATEAEATALTEQIAYLRQRNVKGKEAFDVQRQLTKLEAELSAVRSEGATKLKVLGIEEEAVMTARAQAIAAYRNALDLSEDALRKQQQAIVDKVSMGQQEFALQQKLNEIYDKGALKARELAIALSEHRIDPEVYAEELRAVQESTDRSVAIVKDGYDRMLEAQADWLNGVKAGYADWMAAAADVAGQLAGMTGRALDTVVDGFASAAETGKLEWRNMLISMLRDLEKFLIKQAILKVAYGFLSGGSSNYNPANYSDSSGLAGMGSFALPTQNAKGGVYDSPSLSAYSNKVYDTPQMFAFAKGGVFGEAGPEAIMPLQKDSNGVLGVKALGGSGGGPVMLTVQTNIEANGGASSKTSAEGDGASMYREFTNKMAGIAKETLVREMQPGGTLYRAGVTPQ